MSLHQSGGAVEILLVEDNPGDVRLTLEALREGKVLNRVSVAEDGEEAMEILRRQGRHANALRPDLILLDLNLPGRDGREVLMEIQRDEDLRSIPVVVLTTSRAEEDILKSYNLNANCYIAKPVGIESFVDIVKQIEEFWLTVVRLPPQ